MSEAESDSKARSKDASSDEYGELTATIRDLVNLMREGGIERLDLKRGDFSISLRAQVPSISGLPVSVVPAEMAAEPITVFDENTTSYITSPMIGTFYAAPAPGERTFVEIGDTVEVGQTVAIIEAMKIMNEIVAERTGIVEEILVKNGETVEYGHRLMRLRLPG